MMENLPTDFYRQSIMLIRYMKLMSKEKLPDSCVEMFAEGLVVDSSFTAMPAILNIISYDAFTDTSHIRITIKEGKYHQIKRMFNAVDSEVIYLKRFIYGKYST